MYQQLKLVRPQLDTGINQKQKQGKVSVQKSLNLSQSPINYESVISDLDKKPKCQNNYENSRMRISTSPHRKSPLPKYYSTSPIPYISNQQQLSTRSQQSPQGLSSRTQQQLNDQSQKQFEEQTKTMKRDLIRSLDIIEELTTNKIKQQEHIVYQNQQILNLNLELQNKESQLSQLESNPNQQKIQQVKQQYAEKLSLKQAQVQTLENKAKEQEAMIDKLNKHKTSLQKMLEETQELLLTRIKDLDTATDPSQKQFQHQDHLTLQNIKVILNQYLTKSQKPINKSNLQSIEQIMTQVIEESLHKDRVIQIINESKNGQDYTSVCSFAEFEQLKLQLHQTQDENIYLKNQFTVIKSDQQTKDNRFQEQQQKSLHQTLQKIEQISKSISENTILIKSDSRLIQQLAKLDQGNLFQDNDIQKCIESIIANLNRMNFIKLQQFDEMKLKNQTQQDEVKKLQSLVKELQQNNDKLNRRLKEMPQFQSNQLQSPNNNQQEIDKLRSQMRDQQNQIKKLGEQIKEKEENDNKISQSTSKTKQIEKSSTISSSVNDQDIIKQNKTSEAQREDKESHMEQLEALKSENQKLQKQLQSMSVSGIGQIQKQDQELQHQLEFVQMQNEQLEQIVASQLEDINQLSTEKKDLESKFEQIGNPLKPEQQQSKIRDNREVDGLNQQLAIMKDKNTHLQDKVQKLQSLQEANQKPFWDLEIFSKSSSLLSLVSYLILFIQIKVNEKWVFNIKNQEGNLEQYNQQISVFSFQSKLAQIFIQVAFNCPPHQLNDLKLSLQDEDSTFIKMMNQITLQQEASSPVKKTASTGLKTFLVMATILKKYYSQNFQQLTELDKDRMGLNEFWIKYSLSQNGVLIYTFSNIGLTELQFMRYLVFLQQFHPDTIIIFALMKLVVSPDEEKELAQQFCEEMSIPIVDISQPIQEGQKNIFLFLEKSKTKFSDVQLLIEGYLRKRQVKAKEKLDFVEQLRSFIIEKLPYFFEFPNQQNIQPDFEIVPSESGDSFSLTLLLGNQQKYNMKFNRDQSYFVKNLTQGQIIETKQQIELIYEMPKLFKIISVDVDTCHIRNQSLKVGIRIQYNLNKFIQRQYLLQQLNDINIEEKVTTKIEGNLCRIFLHKKH